MLFFACCPCSQFPLLPKTSRKSQAEQVLQPRPVRAVPRARFSAWNFAHSMALEGHIFPARMSSSTSRVLSKRTWLYALYSHQTVKNGGKAGMYSATSDSDKQNQFSTGVVHTF